LVKTSTLAIILAALIISVVFTGDADGAGLVWRAINKSGSSIHDIANVTERGCGLNQYLSVNSSAKWACTTLTTGSNALLDGSVHTDTVAQTVSRGSIIYGDSTPKWNELVLGVSGQFLFSDGTDVKYGTIKNKLLDGSNHTDTASATPVRGDIIIVDSNTVWNKRTLGASGTFLYSNSTEPVYGTIKNPLLDGSNHTDTTAQTVSRGSIIYGDSTPKWNELAIGGVNTVLHSDGTDPTWQSLVENDIPTLSWSKVSKIGSSIHDIANVTERGCAVNQTLEVNSTGYFACSPHSGTTILSGGNLTTSSNSLWTNIWSIPLTANSGNFISAYIMADTAATNRAVQINTNVTNSNTWGNCYWETPISATQVNLDQIAVNNNTGTGETLWYNANATAITGQCAIFTTGAGNVNINFRSGTSATPVYVLPGSYFVKMP